jgi:hypothetical protein
MSGRHGASKGGQNITDRLSEIILVMMMLLFSFQIACTNIDVERQMNVSKVGYEEQIGSKYQEPYVSCMGRFGDWNLFCLKED